MLRLNLGLMLILAFSISGCSNQKSRKNLASRPKAMKNDSTVTTKNQTPGSNNGQTPGSLTPTQQSHSQTTTVPTAAPTTAPTTSELDALKEETNLISADKIENQNSGRDQVSDTIEVQISNQDKKSGHEVKMASDSDKIKNQEAIFISFKDLKGLQDLEKKNSQVLLKGKSTEESSAIEIIKNGNEEHFCKLNGTANFHQNDYLKFSSAEVKTIDEKYDVFQTTLSFENSNGKLKFICTHATDKIFLQDLRLNIQNFVEISENGKIENHKEYINPRTEQRLLETIQISNLETFNKLIIKSGEQGNSAIVQGKIISFDEAVNRVTELQVQMGCFVQEVLGTLNTTESYVQVDRRISKATPDNIPVAGVYYVYIDSKKNGFILNCIQLKKAQQSVLFSTLQGLIKFGALSRNDYRKSKAELTRVYKEELQPEE